MSSTTSHKIKRLTSIITETIAVKDYSFLCCPGCGDNFLHHDRVTIFDRCEDENECIVTEVNEDGHISIKKSDGLRNPSVRRHGIAIRFWCEHCGPDNPFDLTIAQHKGETRLAWRAE
jgi:hypothetical protein